MKDVSLAANEYTGVPKGQRTNFLKYPLSGGDRSMPICRPPDFPRLNRFAVDAGNALFSLCRSLVRLASNDTPGPHLDFAPVRHAALEAVGKMCSRSCLLLVE